MKIGKGIVITVLLAAIFLLSSCVTGSRKLVKSIKDFESGKVIVVGKVVLHPELGKREQAIYALGMDVLKNGFFIINDNEMKDIVYYDLSHSPLMHKDWYNRIEAHFGETFYALADQAPLYFYGGGIFKKWYWEHGYNTDTLYTEVLFMPIGFRVEIQPGDQAVYIGTLHYYRDDKGDLTKVVREDAYEQELPEFIKRFGNMRLRKANLTPDEGKSVLDGPVIINNKI